MQLFALFSLLLPAASGLKFLSYNTIFARSHSAFMHSLHESLIDAGHEVHVICPIINSQLKIANTRAKIIYVPQSPAALEYERVAENEMITNSWRSDGVASAMEPFIRILNAWHGQCNFTLHYPGLLEQLAMENYDAAFSEPICHCGFGSPELLRFPATYQLFICQPYSGVISPYSERMAFFERFVNFLQSLMPYFIGPILRDPYTVMFKKRFGEQFPTTEEILDKASLHFVNSEPLTDFPQMTTHKIVEIGGISIAEEPRPLNEYWSNVMGLRKKTIIISFGTIAKSSLMPDAYKKTMLRTMQKFPNVTFIWKYEKPEHNISKGIDNLIETIWMPQNDILNDARLSAFLSHGGQGSVLESTKAGVPLVVVPVMGDQERNAQASSLPILEDFLTIKRIETGIVLEKADLAEGDALERAIWEVLEDKEYARKAKAIGKMIRSRPFTPRETFVRNMEFMAENGPLRLLDHYGTQLNIVQYYCMDVIAFILLIVVLTIGSFLACVRAACGRYWRLKTVKAGLKRIMVRVSGRSRRRDDYGPSVRTEQTEGRLGCRCPYTSRVNYLPATCQMQNMMCIM